MGKDGAPAGRSTSPSAIPVEGRVIRGFAGPQQGLESGQETSRTPGRVRGGDGWELDVGLPSSLVSLGHPAPKEKGNPSSTQDPCVRKTEDEGEFTHHKG